MGETGGQQGGRVAGLGSARQLETTSFASSPPLEMLLCTVAGWTLAESPLLARSGLLALSLLLPKLGPGW